ncbi:MAG: hypothetical protein KDB18_11945, partial [Salinibacterium sp.]|nr:hypothetical protein [Salinibacterium sp.]
MGTSGVVAWTVVLPNGFPAGLTSFIQAGIVLPGGTVHLSNTIQSTTLPSLDLIAPEVLSLTSTSLGGADPAVVTIPSTDSFIIEFSKPIDATTLDLQENLVLVHTGIVTPAQPSGVIVAGSIQGDPTQRIFTLTPLAGLGSTASQVVLTVGGNVVPALAITDIPAPNLAVLPLANFKSVTFTTMAATGVPTPASISETFASPLNIDGSFSPRFAAANLTAGGNGQLSGVNITGSAVPGAAPGSRSQVTITPQGTPNFLNPSTLLNFFSPFDDSGLNNFGPAVNPMGGSRLQLMYLANGMELPSGLASSVELLEWSPGGGMVNPGIYNNFSMMMGHTRAQAASPASLGLVTNFDANWDFDNPQNEWIQPATHPSL